jgi:hypothetical protein
MLEIVLRLMPGSLGNVLLLSLWEAIPLHRELVELLMRPVWNTRFPVDLEFFGRLFPTGPVHVQLLVHSLGCPDGRIVLNYRIRKQIRHGRLTPSTWVENGVGAVQVVYRMTWDLDLLHLRWRRDTEMLSLLRMIVDGQPGGFMDDEVAPNRDCSVGVIVLADMVVRVRVCEVGTTPNTARTVPVPGQRHFDARTGTSL